MSFGYPSILLFRIFHRIRFGIQGHRKRWKGFETAITVRVSTDLKLKPLNKKL